jgi:hypothetical protein
MIEFKKINNVKIKPLKIPKINVCDIRGKDYFENLFPNVLLLARKNSGKTTVLYHILKNCTNKKTKVFLFCSTIYKDPSYDVILKMFEKRHIEYEAFTDIQEGKVDHLERIVNKLKEKDEAPEEKDEDIPKKPDIKFLMFGGEEDEEKKHREYVPKKLCPSYIFLFDDISEDLRSPSVAYLMKKNRHLGIMNLISTQSYKDITPPAWRQIDFALLYKNIEPKAIEDIKDKLNLPTPINVFETIYEQAVSGDHSFLYIDKNKVEYRQNFCNKFEI